MCGEVKETRWSVTWPRVRQGDSLICLPGPSIGICFCCTTHCVILGIPCKHYFISLK